MSGTPSWGELIGRESGLRHPNLYMVEGHDYYAPISNDLCAMQAVRFLSANSLLLSGPHDCDGMMHVDTTDGESKAMRFKGDTLDEALRVAVAAVLDAKPAAEPRGGGGE